MQAPRHRRFVTRLKAAPVKTTWSTVARFWGHAVAYKPRLVVSSTSRHHMCAGMSSFFCCWLLSIFFAKRNVNIDGYRSRVPFMLQVFKYIFCVALLFRRLHPLLPVMKVFRRKLSKLDFDLHFCIMTSVWDFSNPPFYWMIS